MFLGILPIIGAGISIIGGLLGKSAENSQRAKQNEAIYKLVELEKENYDLTRRWRASQNRQAVFQFQTERDLMRLNTRQQIFQQNLADSAATIDYYSKNLQADYAIHQANQQRILADQQEQQQRQAGFEAARQVAQQGQQAVAGFTEADQSISQGAAQHRVQTGTTGQGGTKSALAQQELFALAGSNVNQARNTLAGTVLDESQRIKQQTDENYLLNRKILDMQRQYSTEVFHNQLQQEQLALGATANYNASNRQLLQQQQRAFMLGSRANQLAERNRQRHTREADRIGHDSRVTQLRAGIQPTGMGGALFSALAQGVGVAAGYGAFDGLFGGGSGGMTQTAGVGGVPGGTSFGFMPTPPELRNSTGSTRGGLINHFPPGYTGGAATTGHPWRGNPIMQDVFRLPIG
jgi:hypothetical protein